MSDFKKQYKKPPSTFGNVKKIKSDLIHDQQKGRKKRRTKNFEKNRKKKESSQSSTISQKDDEIKRKLLEWKVEREKKIKEQKSQKKPPFTVGIVRHNFYSPITNNSIAITKKKKTIVQAQKKSNNKKEITRATDEPETKLLFRNSNIGKQKAAAILNAKKPPANNNCNKPDIDKSFAPFNHKFNPPAGLSKISFRADNIEDDLTNKNNISACDNSTENVPVSSSNEPSTKDAITKKADMSMEEKEHTVEYFKYLLYKEKNKLQKRCEYWSEIQSQNDITEDTRCCINQAVGQTALLINDKFEQFHVLISLCEKSNDDILITCTDLHGFWDVIYIEVKDCYSRFEKLEKLCARHWREDQSSFTLTNFAKKRTDAKKHAVSVKQNLLQTLNSSNKKKKMQNNKEDSQQILLQPVSSEINMSNEFITPINNKKVAKTEESYNVTRRKCCKDLLKIYANPMYTSTPLNNDVNSNNLRINTLLLTMKISQLYNKSIMQIDNQTCILPVQRTPKKNMIKKSEKSQQSLRIKSVSSDADNLTLKNQSNLEINQNSHVLFKKIDSLEFEKLKISEISERNHIEERPDYITNSSVASSFSTVVEKTIKDKNETLKKNPYNTNLIETPVSIKIEDKKKNS